MLTYDLRTRETEIFGALKTMIEKLKTPSLPAFFGPAEYGTNWQEPTYYVCMESNAVFIYFPSVQKTVTLGEKSSTLLTDAVIAYDFDKDNDNGESFNRTLQKYGIVWNENMWYGAFEEAIQTLREGKDLIGWAPPARPDYLMDTGMQQATQFDLDQFLNGIPEPTEGDDILGDYCPCCGAEFAPEDEVCQHCGMQGKDQFCTHCGTELDVDGSCPNEDCEHYRCSEGIPEDEEDFDDDNFDDN